MRRSMRKRRNMRGGWQVMNPANIGDTSMNASSAQSLAQGQDYERIHAAQHGGAAVSLTAAAPVGYPTALEMSQDPSSRVGPLNQSMQAIQGMSDQSGGRRRSRRNRRNSKKNKKNKSSKKSRRSRSRRQGGGGFMNNVKGALGLGPKADLSGNAVPVMNAAAPPMNAAAPPMNAAAPPMNMKAPAMNMKAPAMNMKMAAPAAPAMNMKAPAPLVHGGGMKFFKNLKAMFSSRKGRKGRKGQRGGAGYQTGPSQSYDAPGMLLSPAAESKALMGMNPEWRLAENPSSFVPK
jgi:hypothetical protein